MSLNMNLMTKTMLLHASPSFGTKAANHLAMRKGIPNTFKNDAEKAILAKARPYGKLAGFPVAF